MPYPDLHGQRGREGRKHSRLRIERVEQRLCPFEVLCVEAFGEPAVDRREKVAGFDLTA